MSYDDSERDALQCDRFYLIRFQNAMEEAQEYACANALSWGSGENVDFSNQARYLLDKYALQLEEEKILFIEMETVASAVWDEMGENDEN